jgi:hypothetical protein
MLLIERDMSYHTDVMQDLSLGLRLYNEKQYC